MGTLLVAQGMSPLGPTAAHPQFWSLFQAAPPAQELILACVWQKSSRLRLSISLASVAPLIAMAVTLEGKRALDTDSGEACI